MCGHILIQSWSAECTGKWRPDPYYLKIVIFLKIYLPMFRMTVVPSHLRSRSSFCSVWPSDSVTPQKTWICEKPHALFLWAFMQLRRHILNEFLLLTFIICNWHQHRLATMISVLMYLHVAHWQRPDLFESGLDRPRVSRCTSTGVLTAPATVSSFKEPASLARSASRRAAARQFNLSLNLLSSVAVVFVDRNIQRFLSRLLVQWINLLYVALKHFVMNLASIRRWSRVFPACHNMSAKLSFVFPRRALRRVVSRTAVKVHKALQCPAWPAAPPFWTTQPSGWMELVISWYTCDETYCVTFLEIGSWAPLLLLVFSLISLR